MEKDQQDSDNWMETHQNRFTYQPELAQNPINLSGADGEILVYLNVFPQINFTSQPSVVLHKEFGSSHTNTSWDASPQQQDPAQAHAHSPGTAGATVQRNTKQQSRAAASHAVLCIFPAAEEKGASSR